MDSVCDEESVWPHIVDASTYVFAYQLILDGYFVCMCLSIFS